MFPGSLRSGPAIPPDFLIEVQKGNVDKHSIIHKFSANDDVDPGNTPEDIWNAGGMLVWQEAAQTVSIVSDNAADDGNPDSNLGAHKVLILGLSPTFVLDQEEVTMEGLTPVLTTKLFIRVYRMVVTQVGTYHGANIGTITATFSSTTDVAAVIGLNPDGLGVGQTQMSHFTVPAATKAYLLSVHQHVDTAKMATITMFQMPNADDVVAPFTGAARRVLTFAGLKDESPLLPRSPLKFVAQTDLWFRAEAVDTVNTAVSVDYELLLVED